MEIADAESRPVSAVFDSLLTGGLDGQAQQVAWPSRAAATCVSGALLLAFGLVWLVAFVTYRGLAIQKTQDPDSAAAAFESLSPRDRFHVQHRPSDFGAIPAPSSTAPGKSGQ